MKTYRALTITGKDIGTFKAPSMTEAVAYAHLVMGERVTVKIARQVEAYPRMMSGYER